MIKDGTYIIDFDEYIDISSYWTTFYANGNTKTYFDSFGVKHIPKIIVKKIIVNKNITTNIYRIQPYNSVMCGFVVLDLFILCLRAKA